MLPSGSLSFGYSVVKDLVRRRRREALQVILDAERMGSVIHLRAGARSMPDSGKITIKRCSAVRQRPYAGCIEGDERSWRASHIPDTGPNKVRSGMEVDYCENVVAGSVRNSRTRP
jgi:hypothetical protein